MTHTRFFFMLMLLTFCNAFACGQSSGDKEKWADDEIADVFDGIDVNGALQRVEDKGITAYDFGFHLLRSGHPDKAIAWYNAIGIKTKQPKYIYGLAWMKWVTGNAQGAIDDARYILARNPPPILHARTLYLLGAVSVDEFDFEAARHNLKAGIEAYKALGKDGGQYLCYTMLAKCAVYEGRFDDVEPLLETAAAFNEKVEAKGKKPYSKGAHHEIMSELAYARGDFVGALIEARESSAAYRLGEEHLAAEVDSKVAFLLILNGEPRAAKKLATALWDEHHDKRNRGRLLAYNAITLMKLSLCSGNDLDAKDKENSARAWAKSGPGGKQLIKLMTWAQSEKNFPCPELQ